MAMTGQAVVVKLGGDVLEGSALSEAAGGIRLALDGSERRMAVVHGGGAQVTALSGALGIAARVVAGRRVTDAAALDVLKMVVAGRLNLDLCAALRARAVAAVGLHAGSGVVRARIRPPCALSGAGPEPVDLGLVGDVTGFDLELLELLWRHARLPVLSCLGIDDKGDLLNLNADLVASRLATALSAAALVSVTAVGGVRRRLDDVGSRIARLSAPEARAAIASGEIQGGMIPKVEEAFVPLASGVASVQIVAPGEIAAGLRAPGSVGTLLVA